MPCDDIPLSEPSPIPDTFASELVRVERIGPCARLIFAVLQVVECGGHSQVERAVVARIVLPAEFQQEIAQRLLAGGTTDLAQAADSSPRTVN
jgi:hypothetical protein